MVKRFFAVMAATLFLAPVVQAAQSEAGLKIAVVSIQKALNEVEQGKKAKADLKSEFDAKQKKLDLQQDELKKMREDLDKKKVVLAPSDLQSKEESFNKKYLELQKNFADYRQEIVQKEGQFTAAIIKNLKEICEEVGKKEGYTLIVENSQDAILYAGAKDDLTDKVIKLYNERNKGPLKMQ